MMQVIVPILDAMFGEARLPDFEVRLQLLFDSERESALDALHSLLQRNLGRGREQHVEVIRHQHEFVEREAALATVFLTHLNEQFGPGLAAKDWAPAVGDCGYEKGPLLLWRSLIHAGAKAPFFPRPDAGLKPRSSTEKTFVLLVL